MRSKINNGAMEREPLNIENPVGLATGFSWSN